MARRIRSQIDNRSKRLNLPIQGKPHGRARIAPGINITYRRLPGPGTWVGEKSDGQGGYTTFTLPGIVADDFEEANGRDVLNFWQATERILKLARGTSTGKPVTWGDALAAYEADLRHRGGDPYNATRIR